MIFREGDEPIMVRWYFADEDAECFPFGHAFGSQNWERGKFDAMIGEQKTPRIWVNGEKPTNGSNGAATTKACMEGDQETWWTEGIPEGEESGPYDEDFIPVCCQTCNCVLPDSLNIQIEFNPGCSGEPNLNVNMHREDPDSMLWQYSDNAVRSGWFWFIDLTCDPETNQWALHINYFNPEPSEGQCAWDTLFAFTCPDPFDLELILGEPTTIEGSPPCPCVDVDNLFVRIQG